MILLVSMYAWLNWNVCVVSNRSTWFLPCLEVHNTVGEEHVILTEFWLTLSRALDRKFWLNFKKKFS